MPDNDNNDNDTFFSKTKCDRCSNDLKVRTMSWFNKDTICMECKDKEDDLKDDLRQTGVNPSQLEGCGYLPTPRFISPSRVLYQ